MARSQRLRLSEVRAVHRLVHECRDLGADWELWRAHWLAGIQRLTDAQVGAFGGAQVVPGAGLLPIGPILFAGWEDDATEALGQEYVRARAAVQNPWVCKFVALGLPTAVRTRTELTDDREWYTSEEFTNWFQRMGLDDSLISTHTHSGTEVQLTLSLHRSPGSRKFERRQCRLTWLLEQETAPLIGTALASVGEPRLLALSPRLRQILLCLLEGDGEKQTAFRIGLSPTTVHQYVGQLYRHFGVNDRAELLSLFLRRSGLLKTLRSLLAPPPESGDTP